jgi:hypothetical protein
VRLRAPREHGDHHVHLNPNVLQQSLLWLNRQRAISASDRLMLTQTLTEDAMAIKGPTEPRDASDRILEDETEP